MRKSITIPTKPAIVVGTLVLAAGVLTACNDKFEEPFKDAPRNGTDNGAATVIEMPDGFSNASMKCLKIDGKNTGVLLVSAYHGDEKYGSVTAVQSAACK